MAAFTAKLFISLIIILPQVSWGRVLSDDISLTSKETFTLKELCQEMVTHPTPLIEVKSITTVDCMGKKINVADFCQKKMVTDPYYLRGYARNDRVECISGKKVIFKYACRKKDRLCTGTAEKSCHELKSKLAYRLDIVHSSFIQKESYKQLNCFYETTPLKN
ncbi:MAG TPA: hypothetical protein VKZ84_01125 [Bacteriovoracaceae bacterium]|nr:hypothetical protein [Bacteriovoracaceae bacterium]